MPWQESNVWQNVYRETSLFGSGEENLNEKGYYLKDNDNRTNLESIISILIVVTFQRRTIRYTDVITNPTSLRLDRDQTLMRLELMRRETTAESPCCSLLARPCGRQGKKRDVMYIVWTTYTWFHRCNLKTEGVQGTPKTSWSWDYNGGHIPTGNPK